MSPRYISRFYPLRATLTVTSSRKLRSKSRSADEARSTASRMEGQGKGAIAFARTGDPQLGEWDDAAILGRYGDVPDDLDSIHMGVITDGPSFALRSSPLTGARHRADGLRVRRELPALVDASALPVAFSTASASLS